jgi:Transmembrane secretion effector
MLKVGRSRSRTGGYRWRLYRSGEDPQLVIEEFTVPSWAEFDRQHSTRWLASDNDALASALRCTVDGCAEEHWYFALAGPAGVLGGPLRTNASASVKRRIVSLNGILPAPWANERV